MENKRRHRLMAAGATIAFHGLLLTALLTAVLRYDSTAEPTEEWPPADSSELLFGGEYVVAGDIPEPGHDDAPAPPAEAASPEEPAEAPVAAEPMITTERPSSARTEKATERAADKKRRDEEAGRRAAEKAERERQASAISSRVSFGSGRSGQPDGKTATGSVSGVSAGGLGNRKAIDLPRPERGPMGKIVVKISVNRQGAVTSASYLAGEGAAAASTAARNSCVAAARRARFTAVPDGPATQTGTLTYNYK